jgi:Cd2+/Zn2+-exporting ATPase
VVGGTVNGNGAIVFRATKVGAETMLAQIIAMVEAAQGAKLPIQALVDRITAWFVPAVMGIAAVTVAAWLLFGPAPALSFALIAGVAVLIIACPCAMGLATPTSIMVGTGRAAEMGVLFRKGDALQSLHEARVVALDKTGTLTRGEPEAAAVTPLGGATEAEVLRVAAALEARSSHPLATAILARAEAAGLAPAAAREARVAPGRGVEGEAEGRPVWLGSERFAREKGLAEALPRARIDAIEQAGSTAVLVGEGDRLIGVIEVRDAVRPEAAEAVAALHRLGVETVVMLTGDNRRTAEAVAARVGIDEVRAELLPEDKVAAIEALGRERKVAMIGDGINDAPAMARADVAVAMGAIGSDAAIETADVALMTDDIGKLPWLIGHSRRALAVIRQNVAFSIGVKVVFAALALANIATLWGAIAADVGASLLVVLNALRLLRPRRGADPGGHGGAAEAEARPAARSGAPAVAAEV